MPATPISPLWRVQKGSDVYHPPLLPSGRSFINMKHYNSPHPNKVLRRITPRDNARYRCNIDRDILAQLNLFQTWMRENYLTVHLWSTGNVHRPFKSPIIQKAIELLLLQYNPELWPWPDYVLEPDKYDDPYGSI